MQLTQIIQNNKSVDNPVQHMNTSAQCHLIQSSQVYTFTSGIFRAFKNNTLSSSVRLWQLYCIYHFHAGKHSLAELLSVKTNIRSCRFTLKLWKRCNLQFSLKFNILTERDTRFPRLEMRLGWLIQGKGSEAEAVNISSVSSSYSHH